jgi:hypothetical protein
MLLVAKLEVNPTLETEKLVLKAFSCSGALNVAVSLRAIEIIDSAAKHVPGSA